MKMKLPWPAYVALTFGLFMAFIVVLVIKTYHVNNELVAEDYYQQELDYQHTIDKRRHVQPALQPHWVQHKNQLIVTFPNGASLGKTTGIIAFYRPSDASKDIKVPLSIDQEGQQVFPIALFTKGLYLAKVDWEQSGISFYDEQELHLQ